MKTDEIYDNFSPTNIGFISFENADNELCPLSTLIYEKPHLLQ